MTQHIGKLLPIEGYQVTIRGNIATSYPQSLTHLYQPLIGVQAISLFQTLLNEYYIKKGSLQTHHTLMTYLSLPLDQIYEARLRLEAIGLLRSYASENEEEKTYLYELHAPFSANEFFEDGMLSQLLLHHIGETKYDELQELFGVMESKYISGQDVTVTFTDIFDTYSPTETDLSKKDKQIKPDNRDDQHGPPLPNNIVDFNWLEKMLKQRMLPSNKVLTPKNKKLMVQLVVLYDLTEQELESAVMWALNEDNKLDSKEFKSACHDLFSSKKQSGAKGMDFRTKVPSNNNETIDKKSGTKEDQFIQMLEQISPKQLLEDLSGGNEASAQDLKVIRDVMTQQGITPEVMNVLVHYVLLKTDMKLSKAYLEKIASHWARKNVTTVRQAMIMAKSENQKYQQWSSSNRQYYKKSTGKKDIVPDWFKERQDASKAKTSENNQNGSNLEEKEDIANLIEKYSKNKQSKQ
ncbi:DnaD domain protein [Aquibacillus sp. 3ASR75-11]|uniref:DnaD domain protein n=1 Tax=Terrihalobacillus insolitus TaxID=2950438 RepID=A0A9X3WSC5_9BACI|nr:DnaD domain protein [Terrihalobacillus insolitus]MDC3412607.1 DnaD domain protein [Terrihalobacillus insolitus]MDC3423958.1 DnaD domain protein [Terrihalobacillus insolitus]